MKNTVVMILIVVLLAVLMTISACGWIASVFNPYYAIALLIFGWCEFGADIALWECLKELRDENEDE